MRRECQEILPGLLLGPFVASKSAETLTTLGVTHMYVVMSLAYVPLVPLSEISVLTRRFDHSAVYAFAMLKRRSR